MRRLITALLLVLAPMLAGAQQQPLHITYSLVNPTTVLCIPGYSWQNNVTGHYWGCDTRTATWVDLTQVAISGASTTFPLTPTPNDCAAPSYAWLGLAATGLCNNHATAKMPRLTATSGTNVAWVGLDPDEVDFPPFTARVTNGSDVGLLTMTPSQHRVQMTGAAGSADVTQSTSGIARSYSDATTATFEESVVANEYLLNLDDGDVSVGISGTSASQTFGMSAEDGTHASQTQVLPTGPRDVTTGAKPTCDATVRRQRWYVGGGAGVADTYEVCMKNAADVYAWVAIATP